MVPSVRSNFPSAVGLTPLEPFIVNWSRLEPLPVTPDLQAGLQARIGDPLWLLGRQWQFNEFQADDAGSPIDVGSHQRPGLSRDGIDVDGTALQ